MIGTQKDTKTTAPLMNSSTNYQRRGESIAAQTLEATSYRIEQVDKCHTGNEGQDDFEQQARAITTISNAIQRTQTRQVLGS